MVMRSSDAEWRGNLQSGKGTMRLGSGAFEGSYSFPSRFESGEGTNPEELIAAAHAGCFTMALSAQLGEAGITAEQLQTKAAVTLDKVGDGFSITAVHLELSARIPGVDRAAFDTATQRAKEGCPVSRLLNAKITLDAKLEG